MGEVSKKTLNKRIEGNNLEIGASRKAKKRNSMTELETISTYLASKNVKDLN